MAAYEELVTFICLLFYQICSIGKTTTGYKTLFEQIKTVFLEFFNYDLFFDFFLMRELIGILPIVSHYLQLQ